MQQTTINMPSGHPVRAMTGLARQIALPGEFAPERFPSFPALERTAVMAFNQPASLVLPTNLETKMMLVRQAGFPLWADQPTTGQAWQYTYSATGAASTLDVQLEVGYLTDTPRFGTAVGSALPGRPAVTSGVVQNVFTYPVLGIDHNAGANTWFYKPAGYDLTFSVGLSTAAALAANCNLRVVVEYWLKPGELLLKEYPISMLVGQNTGVVNVGATGDNEWWRPRNLQVQFGTAQATGWTWLVSATVCSGTFSSYTASGVDGGTITYTTPSVVRGLIPLVIAAEFANSRIPWQATRTTAAAVLGTNVTQVLNKAGTILAGRVNPDTINPFNVLSTYVAGLHPAEKAWLPLETGVYSYCPPSTDMTAFWDYTSQTLIEYPVYRLDNESLVNVMFFKPGATDETLAITASWHLEFRTTSALFQIALSGMTLESFHQAQLALAAAGFFFHNPDHKAILSRVTDAVKKVAPHAISVLSAANPVMGSIAKSAYKAARPARKVKVPQAPMRMPTTTASASGQNGPKGQKKPKPKGGKRQGKR